MHRFHALAALPFAALALPWGAAQAQANSASQATTVAISAPDECKRAYVKFEEAIGLLRRTQGNEAAAAVKEKLLPAKLHDEILLSEELLRPGALSARKEAGSVELLF